MGSNPMAARKPSSMSMIEALAAMCRASRVGSGVSAARIAEHAGVSENEILAFERGDHRAQDVELIVRAFAAATDTTARNLWSGAAGMLDY